MAGRLAPLYATGWRAVVVLLTLEVAATTALRYFGGGDPPPPPILANAYANPFLIVHAAAGVAALVLAPLQFVGAIRRGWPALHRAIGQVCVIACVFGAPAGFMLALGTTAGPVAATGFALAAVLWGLFTWQGWRAAVQRRLAAHREWMLRAYAVVATAITLRLMLPAATLLMGLDFGPAYRVIAWASWLANLALAEAWIRRTRAAPREHRIQISTVGPGL